MGRKCSSAAKAKCRALLLAKYKVSVAVADDEELDEAEQRTGVAVAGIVLVFDDLLHGAARVDAEGLQLDLDDGDAVDEQKDVVAVVAVVGIDAELVDDLEGRFCTSPGC